jgi:hypothetical protein
VYLNDIILGGTTRGQVDAAGLALRRVPAALNVSLPRTDNDTHRNHRLAGGRRSRPLSRHPGLRRRRTTQLPWMSVDLVMMYKNMH